MAESVDALVSNTSGATRAGSTPALGTGKGGFCDLPFLVPAAGAEPVPFFSSPQRTGRPSGTALARILASPQYVFLRVRGGRDGWNGLRCDKRRCPSTHHDRTRFRLRGPNHPSGNYRSHDLVCLTSIHHIPDTDVV